MSEAEQANAARVPRRGRDERAETLRYYRGLPETRLQEAYGTWLAAVASRERELAEARRHLATIEDVQRERGG